jgi:hypothetical protein
MAEYNSVPKDMINCWSKGANWSVWQFSDSIVWPGIPKNNHEIDLSCFNPAFSSNHATNSKVPRFHSTNLVDIRPILSVIILALGALLLKYLYKNHSKNGCNLGSCTITCWQSRLFPCPTNFTETHQIEKYEKVEVSNDYKNHGYNL